MKKYTLSLLTLSVALSSGAAFAAGLSGDTVTQTVDLTFAETSVVSHDIESAGLQEPGLLGNEVVLANGKVTTNKNVYAVELRFSGEVSDANMDSTKNSIRGTFRGASTNNPIVVRLRPSGASEWKGHGSGSGTPWLRIGSTGTGGASNFTYSVHSALEQEIEPDVYTVSVDAQAYRN